MSVEPWHPLDGNMIQLEKHLEAPTTGEEEGDECPECGSELEEDENGVFCPTCDWSDEE